MSKTITIPVPKGATIRFKYRGEWSYAIMQDNPVHQLIDPPGKGEVYECVWKKGLIVGRKKLTLGPS